MGERATLTGAAMPIANHKSTIPTPFTFSQSSLQDYADCPRRFQLRYVEELAWPAVETEPALENERRQQEGLFFHRLVQQRLVGLPVEKLGRMANSPNLSQWWQNFVDFRGLENFGSLYPETTLSAPLGGHRLMAKYDLIAATPGEKAVIFDWKTYQKRPKDEWMAARLQTRVYRALLVRAGSHLNSGQSLRPEQVEMIYWYANYPQEPSRFPYTAAQYKRDWDTLTRLVAEILAQRDFPLTGDEKRCAYCPYRSYCNRGVEAGTMNGMAETELMTLDVNLEQIQEIEF